MYLIPFLARLVHGWRLTTFILHILCSNSHTFLMSADVSYPAQSVLFPFDMLATPHSHTVVVIHYDDVKEPVEPQPRQEPL